MAQLEIMSCPKCEQNIEHEELWANKGVCQICAKEIQIELVVNQHAEIRS